MLQNCSTSIGREDFLHQSPFSDTFGKLSYEPPNLPLHQNAEVCKKSKVREPSVSKEVKKSSIKNSHICIINTCQEKFFSEEELKIHMKLHIGVQPFICETCGKVCLTQNKLNIHEDSHKKDLVTPVCTICSRNFSTQSALNKHMKMIHDKRPFKCLICNSGFEKYDYLSIHIERSHKSSDCPNLPKDCESDTEKNISDSRAKDDTEPPDKMLLQDKYENCSYSDRSSSCARISVESDVIGSSNMRFTCHLCTSTFPTSAYLQQHMSVHYIEKQPCHVCGTFFSSFRELANHLQTHSSNEQSKVTLDFSGYNDSSYFPLTPFSASAQQCSLSPIQYPASSFNQFSPYQQQQSSQPFYFMQYSQCSPYSDSLQYGSPFYSDRRNASGKDDYLSTRPYSSMELSERGTDFGCKYTCHRCLETFTTYELFRNHLEKAFCYPSL